MSRDEAGALLATWEPLCWRLAWQFGRDLREQDREEIAGAVRERLVRCARGFDPALGFSFSTYSHRLAVFTARAEARRLRGGGLTLPSDWRVAVPAVGSLDEPLGPGDGRAGAELVPAPADQERPDWPADFWDRARRHLTGRQWECLTLCYRHGLSMAVAGGRLGVTRSMVQQTCARAVERLRKLGVFDSLRDAV